MLVIGVKKIDCFLGNYQQKVEASKTGLLGVYPVFCFRLSKLTRFILDCFAKQLLLKGALRKMSWETKWARTENHITENDEKSAN